MPTVLEAHEEVVTSHFVDMPWLLLAKYCS